MTALARGSARRALAWLPVLVWMAVIFRLSSVPGSQVPGKYGSLGHLVLYAVLGALVYAAARPRGARNAAAIAVVVASLYGVTDELHQAFVPGRMPDVMDWAVDTVGAALTAGLLLWRAERTRAASRRPS